MRKALKKLSEMDFSELREDDDKNTYKFLLSFEKVR
jgi:hypothetical protein